MIWKVPGTSVMDYGYLKFLAQTGTVYIHPLEKAATDILIRELDFSDGQHVLELGCGTGGTIVRVCGRFRVNLTALDHLDEMLAASRKRVQLTGLTNRVSFLKGNLSPLPFHNGSFDRVYAESVLGILSSDQVSAVLSEVHRVLDPKGKVILNDAIWKKSVTDEQAQTINGACIRDFGLPLASELAWKVDDWTNLFQHHRFRVQSFRIDDYSQANRATIQRPSNWHDLASETMTSWYKLIRYLNPDFRRKKRQYDSLLKQHQDDGNYIESWIFKLTKIVDLSTM